MLRPTKHMDPDRSVLALTTALLKRLRQARLEKYPALLRFAVEAMPDGDTLFPGAMSLLYLLGLVEYRPKADAFEYVGP
jgi:hypothetical protein